MKNIIKNWLLNLLSEEINYIVASKLNDKVQSSEYEIQELNARFDDVESTTHDMKYDWEDLESRCNQMIDDQEYLKDELRDDVQSFCEDRIEEVITEFNEMREGYSLDVQLVKKDW
tara:strand:+ start:537 stop:884 length:348 start_codon:yes stop_codon:yes gene_type:complete